MAKGVHIKIDGLKNLQKRVGNIANEIVSRVDLEMSKAANDYANKAINDTPVDEGLLRQGISAKKVKVLHHETVSAADYSAYVEFGTKDKRDIPPDLTSYAAQFKGKGKGTGKGLFEKILAWVKRKGIAGRYSVKSRKKLNSKEDKEREYQAARAIFYHILKYGTKAQPFFFKHRKAVYAQLQKELGPAIKKALEK